VNWHIAMRPGKRRALDANRESGRLSEKLEQLKASVRAKVEHPFRVIKQQFGHAKVRYRGLDKNTARLTLLFALSNLWMVRRQILGARGSVRLRGAKRAPRGSQTSQSAIQMVRDRRPSMSEETKNSFNASRAAADGVLQTFSSSGPNQ
jgi:hypothetical protein